jgi:2-oxoglutarate dehydrogenase E1 component
MKAKINGLLEEAYVDSKTYTFEAEDWVTSQWEEIKKCDKTEAKFSGVPIDRLTDVGNKITLLPDEKNGEFHRLIKKIFEIRNKTIVSGKNIDWGTAEALAFSTLIQDGYHVRLSGQDVERGTFSHRHAHVFYQNKEGYYNPIDNAVTNGTERKFIASNSHLSEFAVMGFELGYAQTHPNTLVLWEAQFGDFANGAQVIID